LIASHRNIRKMEKPWTNVKFKKIISKDTIMSSQKATKQTGKLSPTLWTSMVSVVLLVGLRALRVFSSLVSIPFCDLAGAPSN
jgi:hypothetical protein